VVCKSRNFINPARLANKKFRSGSVRLANKTFTRLGSARQEKIVTRLAKIFPPLRGENVFSQMR
jgi:hypothetical protein